MEYDDDDTIDIRPPGGGIFQSLVNAGAQDRMLTANKTLTMWDIGKNTKSAKKYVPASGQVSIPYSGNSWPDPIVIKLPSISEDPSVSKTHEETKSARKS